MKRFLYSLAGGLLCLFFFCQTLRAQECDDEDFLDDCAELLGEYTFAKSFNVNAKKTKKGKDQVEYSYVFSKGTNYIITICDREVTGNRMMLNLYDRNHKLIASNFNKRAKKYYTKIGYACAATGVYYLVASFSLKADGRVSILGFKK